jgi:hypothetical protein
MQKTDWKLIEQLILGILLALLICIPMFLLTKKAYRQTDVNWIGYEICSWNSVQNSQKVARITLGLRRDGKVVWREEKLDNWQRGSYLFFEPQELK